MASFENERWIRGRRDYPLSLIMIEIIGHLVGPFALLEIKASGQTRGSQQLLLTAENL